MSTPPGSWENRRRFMYTVSLFCAGAIVYCLGMNLQSAVAETAVTMSYATLIGIVGSYVFGATWDDKNARSQ